VAKESARVGLGLLCCYPLDRGSSRGCPGPARPCTRRQAASRAKGSDSQAQHHGSCASPGGRVPGYGPGTGAVCVRAMPEGSYVQRAAAFTPGPGGATTSRGYTGRNIAGLQHTFLARPLERAARFNTTIFCKPGFGRVCVTWDFCFGSNPKPLFSTL